MKKVRDITDADLYFIKINYNKMSLKDIAKNLNINYQSIIIFCKKNSLSKKNISIERLIEKCISQYGDVYDYSLVKSAYAKDIITIICKQHGEFTRRVDSFLSGSDCHECSKVRNRAAGFKEKEKYLIKKSKKVHGNIYDYSKVIYNGDSAIGDKVYIGCKIHGFFKQYLSQHACGSGCRKCGIIKQKESQTYSQEEIVDKLKSIYKDRLTYDRFEYRSIKGQVIVTCVKHGDFTTNTSCLLNGSKCPKCRRSFGEEKIAQFLENNKIFYIEQFSDITCKYKKRLYFDFMIPKYKIIIEYDGKQHFCQIDYFGGASAFQETVQKDKIKNLWAKDNGYQMIRISYKNKDSIDSILHRIINNQKVLDKLNG